MKTLSAAAKVKNTRCNYQNCELCRADACAHGWHTNVEKMCAAMEAEYKAIDKRCEKELRRYAARYHELIGIPVDAYGNEPEDDEAEVVTNPHGRPRASRRLIQEGTYL